MTATVTLSAIDHFFDGFQALSDINLEIDAGEYITLLGPSGCGKTTLLSILGGFLEPTKGTVAIDGHNVTLVPPAKRPTTTMFQDYALFPHMSLRDNVGFGPRMAGQGRTQRNQRADEMLALVGLDNDGGKRPHALSGGQRQRVALARALAVSPDVLLLDEPLGALDLALRRNMQDELKAIQRRVGTTFVHVTHDQEEAMAIADRIVVMNAGRIEDVGPPARIYREPASLFSASFMGETNRIQGRATGAGIETAFGRIDRKGPEGDVVLCLRPEDVGRAGAFRIGKAQVKDASFFGTHTRAHLVPEAAPDQIIVAHLPPGDPPAPGDTIELAADPAGIAIFVKG